MNKNTWKIVRDFAVRNSKLVFPVIIIIAVVATVTFSLKASSAEELEQPSMSITGSTIEEAPTPTPEILPQETTMERNSNEALYTLINTYYSAYAAGDVETIKSISSYMEDTEGIRIREMAKYVESYPLIEIYTKPGPREASYLAYVYFHMTVTGFEEEVPGMDTFYVCTNESGLYLNTDEVVPDDELGYIREMNMQDDVVELNNQTNVECNEIFLNNADLFYYVQELVADVKKTTGEVLAAQNSGEAQGGEDGGGEEEQPPVEAAVAQPTSGTATTTVNVRSSDSERADKIGKVAGGTEVQIVEQQLNGWTHIIYEGKDGYIKSEYLRVAETADASQVIGQVTATTNINVRLSPSLNAAKLGVLTGGDTVDLLEKADGWCKVIYSGQIGYIKEEYVQ
ncbi:MAG: SH3 domain-containing protein [bacterium]|nr:SH3 domain-containing protein [bacterium]MCM1376371.1 SH3 domain-containing protein [Muribaculum sp.]